MPTPRHTPISQLPRQLAAATGQVSPLPRKLYEHVLRGTFPADYLNGRWYFDETRLPEIVTALGLSPRADIAV